MSVGVLGWSEWGGIGYLGWNLNEGFLGTLGIAVGLRCDIEDFFSGKVTNDARAFLNL